MSHFTGLKTNISELDLLIKTLDDLNIGWEKKSEVVNLFNGETKKCALVIKQKNNHEIGFSKNGLNYELIYDEAFWQQSFSVSNFKDQLNTYYSVNLVTKNLNQEGFEVIEQTNETNFGNVKIKLNALRY
jgi:hypothetical protein